MTLRAFLITALLFLGSRSAGRAEDIPAAEKSKIEALLAHLESLSDAKFNRNGTDYDAKSAVKFLRGKWQANGKAIKSATDFITVAATRSSTSGKLYTITLKDAAPTPCADYLSAQLKRLDSTKNR